MGQEIVDLTIETTGPKRREMEAAIETEDWPGVRRLSHRMKGATANSGVQRMSAMVAKTEDQANSWAPGRVKRLLWLQLPS